MRQFFCILFCLLLASCASAPPIVQRNVDEMENYYSKKDYLKAYESAIRAADDRTYETFKKIKAYMDQRPEISKAGSKYLQQELDKCKDQQAGQQCSCLKDTLTSIERFISLGKEEDIREVYKKYVSLLNYFEKDGLEYFSVDTMPDFIRAENRERLIDLCQKQIDLTLSNKKTNPATKDNIDFLLLRDDSFKNLICKRSDELLSMPEEYYHKLVFLSCEDIRKKQLENASKKLLIDIADEDFELKDYIIDTMKFNCLIKVVNEASPKYDYRIAIKRLVAEFRPAEDRVKQVIVPSSQYELGALIYYPRGSSVIYNVHEGDVSFKYAYKLQVYKENQLLLSDVVKGNQSDSYRFADSPRCQNVFGGVSAAPIYPNQQMAYDFSSGKHCASEEELHRKAYGAIYTKILEVDGISRLFEVVGSLCR